MSLTWNFSSSDVTSPWALARGVWHLSIHWCTWDMESEGRSQHCALQLNMRPCTKETQIRHVLVKRHRLLQTKRARSFHVCTDKTTTCILRMWSLSRLWTISSTEFCIRAWCASAISVNAALFTQSKLTGLFKTSLAFKPDRTGCTFVIHGKAVATLLYFIIW